MSGCFGNNFWDKSMENELFRHLDEEDRYEQWWDEVMTLLEDELEDDLQEYYRQGLSPQGTVKKIHDLSKGQ